MYILRQKNMQSSTFLFKPIGYFSCPEKERYDLPKQPGLHKENSGKIILNSQQNLEQAVEDLAGFSHIWVIFLFHKNRDWKPKVLTPRGEPKRGVLATRSPHRPNPIGMSCLELTDIKGLELYIANHDLLDQTPILDIKPYIEYSDAKVNTRQGWLNDSEVNEKYKIRWSPLAEEQISYLDQSFCLNMREAVEFRLLTNPLPNKNNRIVQLTTNQYQLAYKTWRLHFAIEDIFIHLIEVYSGYDQDTLNGTRSSKWNDVHEHLMFNAKFSR